MLTQPLYIDVMLNGSFICQVTYTQVERIEFYKGQPLQVRSDKKIQQYIEQQHPELKGKPFNLKITTQPLPQSRRYEHRTLRY